MSYFLSVEVFEYFNDLDKNISSVFLAKLSMIGEPME